MSSGEVAAKLDRVRGWLTGSGYGGPIGYLSREFDVVPGTPGAAEVIASGTAFAWNPTVRGAKSEDTFVVGRAGAVPITNTADWPVTASGRPAILPV
jgi:hypothetical protein